jgi:hypothetical protein
MNFTESDINQLVESFRERLLNAAQKLESPSPNLIEIQDWMQKENIENSDVLNLVISKLGKGEIVEKKNAPNVPKN